MKFEVIDDKTAKPWPCKLCNQYFLGFPDNGAPLVDGDVCRGCLPKVILERFRLAREERKENALNERLRLAEQEAYLSMIKSNFID